MNIIQMLPFLAVAVLALFGTLGRHFDDNLLQRVGMSLLGVGGAVSALAIYNAQSICNPATLMAYGVVFYGAGVALKVVKYK